MTIFAIVHRPTGDNAASYDVPSEDIAKKSLDDLGFPYDFVDEATYNDFVARLNQPKG